MLTGQYFVLLHHQCQFAPKEKWHPNAWMGRHITPQSAMHQARGLAAWFQKVRVWDMEGQDWIATYFQYAPLDRDELDPGFEEFYKAVLERPEGTVHTIKKRGIHAFNRHDRNADYEARRKRGEYEHNHSNESESSDGEDVRGSELG